MSGDKTPREVLKFAARVVAELKLREEHRFCEHRRYCEHAAVRREHCKHGTYVGGWAGPDYLCGYCEDGIGDHEYALRVAWDRQQAEAREVFRRIFDGFFDAMDSAWEIGGGWLSAADRRALGEAVAPLARVLAAGRR